jgi:S1-C subfamily serine protease
MQPVASRALAKVLFTAFLCIFLGGCSWFKGETIRVPTICTNAPYCVPEDENVDALISSDRDRHNLFVKRAAESVVIVNAARYADKDGLRHVITTGALIGHKGLVLTTFHGVTAAQFITVTYRRMTDGGVAEPYREVQAELVYFSRERDVAVLRVLDRTAIPAPFPLRRGPSAPADKIWYFGIDTAVGKTVLGDTDAQFNNSRDWMVTGATIGARDAGAPIVNSCGELVGLLLFDNGKGVVYAFGIDGIFKVLDLKMQDLY